MSNIKPFASEPSLARLMPRYRALMNETSDAISVVLRKPVIVEVSVNDAGRPSAVFKIQKETVLAEAPLIETCRSIGKPTEYCHYVMVNTDIIPGVKPEYRKIILTKSRKITKGLEKTIKQTLRKSGDEVRVEFHRFGPVASEA